MATVISKQNYQSRAKRIWLEILKRESEHSGDVLSLERKLVALERKIKKFRTWQPQGA